MREKMKLLIHFPRHSALEPITYNLVKDYDVKINILKALVNDNVEGFLFIEADAERENLKKAVRYLKDIGLQVEKNGTSIFVDKDKCIHCGTCIAACNVGALTMDEEHHLVVRREKCIECALCVKVCPQRIIRDVFAVKQR